MGSKQLVSNITREKSFAKCITNLVDVLALELRDELVETLVIGVNTNGRENTLDISGRGGSVASEGEEEVGCHVLHFEWFSAST